VLAFAHPQEGARNLSNVLGRTSRNQTSPGTVGLKTRRTRVKSRPERTAIDEELLPLQVADQSWSFGFKPEILIKMHFPLAHERSPTARLLAPGSGPHLP
jgi:hypothetical protein